MAWRVADWQCRQGSAWRGGSQIGNAGKARHGTACLGVAGLGASRLSGARQCRHSWVGQSPASLGNAGKAKLVRAWPSEARQCRLGGAWLVLVW